MSLLGRTERLLTGLIFLAVAATAGFSLWNEERMATAKSPQLTVGNCFRVKPEYVEAWAPRPLWRVAMVGKAHYLVYPVGSLYRSAEGVTVPLEIDPFVTKEAC